MAKEDLKLRVTSNAPLSTKGSALTWVELDANWIEIYNAFVSLSQSSYVPTYNASVTYDSTINNYVMYASQIWKCIAASPIIAITPVEGVNWTKKYATDLVGKGQLQEKKITLTANQINSAFSSEVELISARGSGTYIELVSGAFRYNYGTVALYATTGYLKTDTGINVMATIPALNGVVDIFRQANTTAGDVIENKGIVFATNADDTSLPLGDGTIDIYLIYRVVTI